MNFFIFIFRQFFTKSLLVFILFNSFLIIISSAQPIQGCYPGAYLGCGSSDLSCITPQQFNAITGKNHYCFSRYINANQNGDLLNTTHWLWADSLKALGARPVFFLMPFGTLQDYHNGTKDAALTQFAQSCAAYQETVYIVFGHEMNGTWYDWGNDATNYKLAFCHVKTLMSAIAPNIQLCWVPVQAWAGGDYDLYYPGNAYVDWVGLNLYDRDYDENNQFNENELDAALNFKDFYHNFSEVNNKPMLIGETSLFDPNWDPTDSVTRVPLTTQQLSQEKNQWIASLYNKDTLQGRYPNLNMIIYFDVEKQEPDFATNTHHFGILTVDWRIPLLTGYNTYSGLITDSYFVGAVPLGIGENNAISSDNEPWIKAYPNPVSEELTIEFYLPEKDTFQIYLANSTGQKVTLLKEGKMQGKSYLVLPCDMFIPGIYFIKFEARANCMLLEKKFLIQ